ncbi:DUF1295 domain-containing protein, partial [Mycobacterium tuberculosis]
TSFGGGWVFNLNQEGKARCFRIYRETLSRFSCAASPANRGVIMDRGLWAWTRHPNYFGDACVWWGLWLITINDWAPLATVGSPLLMTYLLVDVSGARLTERYLKGRPGFAEYQRRTAYFVPRPPRSARR